jgi:Family of unknown function (DUF6159)
LALGDAVGFFIVLFLRRITNTWAFMWQSFELVRSYRPLMLLPVISSIFCLLVSVIVVGSGILVFDLPVHGTEFAPAVPRVTAAGAQNVARTGVRRFFGYDDDYSDRKPPTAEERRTTEHGWLILFFFYIANYTVISYFNVAFASIVLNHLSGGQATLNDGLQVAWERKGSILQWAILASTVGVMLKMISTRTQLGRFIANILGYTWRLGSYFAIPLLATQNMGAGEALQRSAEVLKQKWGEVVIAQFSFSLLLAILALPGAVALFLLAGFLGQTVGFVVLLSVAYWIFLSIFIFCAEQVFVSALYRYATQSEVSKGFTRNDLESAWESLQPLPVGQAL